jgi:hypothetical protein
MASAQSQGRNTKGHVVSKRTCQGGKAKTSSMNKGRKSSFKPYRGQGK